MEIEPPFEFRYDVYIWLLVSMHGISAHQPVMIEDSFVFAGTCSSFQRPKDGRPWKIQWFSSKWCNKRTIRILRFASCFCKLMPIRWFVFGSLSSNAAKTESGRPKLALTLPRRSSFSGLHSSIVVNVVTCHRYANDCQCVYSYIESWSAICMSYAGYFMLFWLYPILSFPLCSSHGDHTVPSQEEDCALTSAGDFPIFFGLPQLLDGRNKGKSYWNQDDNWGPSPICGNPHLCQKSSCKIAVVVTHHWRSLEKSPLPGFQPHMTLAKTSRAHDGARIPESCWQDRTWSCWLLNHVFHVLFLVFMIFSWDSWCLCMPLMILMMLMISNAAHNAHEVHDPHNSWSSQSS